MAEYLFRSLRYASELERTLFVVQLVMQAMAAPRHIYERMRFDPREFRMFAPPGQGSPIGEMIRDPTKNGMAPLQLREEVERYEIDYRYLMDRIAHEARDRLDVRELLMRLVQDLRRRDVGGFMRPDMEHLLMRYLDFLHHEWDRPVPKPKDKEKEEGFFGKLFGKR